MTLTAAPPVVIMMSRAAFCGIQHNIIAFL